ncbi:MAG: hypothetical protein K5790_01550 [Nitrosopumilus sp.]|uniref:hypothetical protein n=1 Tax=Nitrosopumilus sp. TaxID=2024843 RepID=UPI00247C247F|nr:hypothetical protein [Nitrosopumilus sp.]MCV0391959.1 hypothetical protein [Nitrosopumilus sp.]
MKTRLLMLIVVVIGLSTFVVFSIILHYVQPSKTDKIEVDSIYGFAIDDEFGNVRHYPIGELDIMPCEDFISIWDPVFLELNEADMLNEKLSSCRASLLEVIHANTVCSQYWRVELMEMNQDPKYDFLNDPIYQECSEVLNMKNLCEANGDTWIREKLECVKENEN